MILSDRIQQIVKAENISAEELALMVRHAAKASVRGFNRRYFHWIFQIEGEYLSDMQHSIITEIGTGDSKINEEHFDCYGKGCHECGWVGWVNRWITDKPVPRYGPLKLRA